MSKDLILELAPETSMSKLRITTDSGAMVSELMQRVVVAMLLHTADDSLKINGSHIGDIVISVTTAGILNALRSINSACIDLKKMLNEGLTTDDEDYINSLSVSSDTADSSNIVINVSIQRANSKTETGVLYING